MAWDRHVKVLFAPITIAVGEENLKFLLEKEF